MQNYKSLVSILILFIFMVMMGLIIEVNPIIRFENNEIYTPRASINKELQHMKKLQLVQLLNWPIIKQRIMQSYPMISNMSLQLKSFPKIIINISEKEPWVIILNNNNQEIYSYDGTLLNPNIADVELPNHNIMIINSEKQLSKDNKITGIYLKDLQELSNGLKTIPFFEIQQIIISESKTELISNTGIRVNFGKVVNTIEKFEMLKYFISNQRKNLDNIELIDIQFPKRVIIK